MNSGCIKREFVRMVELLLECVSEDIPSRFQRHGAEQLESILLTELRGIGLSFNDSGSFSSKRRIGVFVTGLLKKIEGKLTQKRGPAVGSSDRAVQGFATALGVSSGDLKKTIHCSKEYYLGEYYQEGTEVINVISGVIERSLSSVVWPKSMKISSSGQ